MRTSRLRVAVIGSGIAGLTVAAALKQLAVECVDSNERRCFGKWAPASSCLPTPLGRSISLAWDQLWT